MRSWSVSLRVGSSSELASAQTVEATVESQKSGCVVQKKGAHDGRRCICLEPREAKGNECWQYSARAETRTLRHCAILLCGAIKLPEETYHKSPWRHQQAARPGMSNVHTVVLHLGCAMNNNNVVSLCVRRATERFAMSAHGAQLCRTVSVHTYTVPSQFTGRSAQVALNPPSRRRRSLHQHTSMTMRITVRLQAIQRGLPCHGKATGPLSRI